MTQINDAPRKPTDKELPASYNKLVHIDKLKRDHLNVRNADPSPTLIQDIHEMGFVNSLITREDPQNTGEYFITDGWQRYQSACELGFTHVPIKICDDKNQATRFAESHSRGKEWDDIADYNQDYIRIKKVFIEEEGMTEGKAIDKRTEEREVTRETIKKNFEIAQLPPKVKELLKEPNERENGFHERWDVKGCLTKNNGSLNKENAHFIAKRYINNDLSENDAFKFGLRSTKNPDMDVLRQALEKYTYDNLSVKEAFGKAKNEVASRRTSSKFNVGMINLPEEDKKVLSRYISHKYQQPIRKYFNQLVREEKDKMLEEINKDKYLTDEWTFQDMRDRMK